MEAVVENTTVKVGDWIGFKSDVEQSGRIKKIKNGRYGKILVLENENGFKGDYIRGSKEHTVYADECWVG